MPYNSRDDLPGQVTDHLPAHAQDIYKEAYNSAWEQYSDREDREATAHQVAWSAVKEKYEKGEDGDWHPKD